LLAFGSWRLLFVLNVPVVALALLLALSNRYDDSNEGSPARLDPIGVSLFAGLLLVVTLLLNGNVGSPGDPAFLGSVAAAAAMGLVLVPTQRRSMVPVAEWVLFRISSFTGATVYVLVTNLAMYTTLLAVPFFISEFLGRPASTTGFLLGAMSVGMAVMAPIGGIAADLVGRRLPSLIGAVAALIGAVAILFELGDDASFAYLAASLAVLGLGIGLGSGPATTAAIEAAPLDAAARAAGTNSMMRYAGSILGAGMLAGVLDTDAAAPALDTFRLVFVVVVAMMVLAVLVAIPIHRFPEEAEAEPLATRA